MQRSIFSVSALASFFALLILACKHEPLVPVDPLVDPPAGSACSPDSVYFQNQILPLLVSNCTESGCHNAQDHEEDIVLTSYQTLMSTVERISSNDWEKNKLIKSLQETKIEERMPQNKPPFTTDQINMIKKWVSQGALNNACDESFGGCDTLSGARYATFVQPLVQSKCKGCHSGSNPQGGIKLTTYLEIKALALDGRLYSSVTASANWMPKGGARLDDCKLAKLKQWVDAGALEN